MVRRPRRLSFTSASPSGRLCDYDPYYNRPKYYVAAPPEVYRESTSKKTKGNKVYKTTTVKNQYGQTVYKNTTSHTKKKKK